MLGTVKTAVNSTTACATAATFYFAQSILCLEWGLPEPQPWFSELEIGKLCIFAIVVTATIASPAEDVKKNRDAVLKTEMDAAAAPRA